MATIVCLGTGPSLTMADVDTARRKGFELYGCNRVYQDVPDLTVLHGCNSQFWDAACTDLLLRQFAGQCFTTRPESAAIYPWLHYIAERDERGLSSPHSNYLHHGHSTGYQLLGLAYRAGADRIILLGYDMTFAPDYDGRTHTIGSTPRHYFGEYPAELQHWPSKQVHGGVHVELLDYYQSVADQELHVPIINCSRQSALTCFPRMPIEEVQ
jgi:hypothetical protein